MLSRPSMPARDSSGRQVSLLNDEPTARTSRPQFHAPNYSSQPHDSPLMIRSHSNTSIPSSASSPCTPGLMRANSYDSQNTSDPHSPTTPPFMDEYGRQSSYTGAAPYKESAHYEQPAMAAYEDYQSQQYSLPMRPQYADTRTSSYAESRMYEEEPFQNGKAVKRYYCRFRESLNCDKTFTTSGHASRHSKIHTAEKAVHCSFSGCQKKFTRADNMKQHLETHYKERSRSSAAQKAGTPKTTLTMPAGVKKPITAGRTNRTPSRADNRQELPPLDPAMFASSQQYAPNSAAPSPATPYSMGGFKDALLSPPVAARSELSHNGLDALAFAAVCQGNQS